MSYYFLSSGLPALDLGTPPVLGLDDFLRRSDELLPAADAEQIRSFVMGEACSHPFAVAWQDRECQIRNAIVRHRAHRLGREPDAALRSHAGYDVFTLRAAEEALGKVDPLERELALDRLRWTVLDELGGLDMFSIEYVLAYAMKLRIAERWAARTDDAGRKRFEAVLATMMAGTQFGKET